MSLLTTAQFGAAMTPPVSASRVKNLIRAGRIKCHRINARMTLIDSRELPKVAVRRPGRPILTRPGRAPDAAPCRECFAGRKSA